MQWEENLGLVDFKIEVVVDCIWVIVTVRYVAGGGFAVYIRL